MSLKKKQIYIILGIIILAQMIYIGARVAYQKKDFHSDELWQYGLANSYYQKSVFCNQQNEVINFNQWQSADILRNYLTVQENQRFNYASLYDNSVVDLHPPLYMAVLHTICSLFPNTFSIWYALSINLICFMVTQIYLFRLMKLWEQDDLTALLTCIVFGFGVSGLNLFSFLRLYALAAPFMLMFIYYSCRILKNENKKDFIKMAVALFLGAMASHTVLITAFFVVLFMVLYFLIVKKFKLFFAYGLSALLSVGASILVFPATINHMFSGYDNTYDPSAANFSLDFRVLRKIMVADILGINITDHATMTVSYIGYGLLVFVFFLIPVCFIFRNEDWFKRIVNGLKNYMINIITKGNKAPFILLLVFVVQFVITAYTCNINRMGVYANRYMFITYPFVYAVLIFYIAYVLRMIFANKRVVANIALIVGVVLNLVIANVFINPISLGMAPEGRVEISDFAEDANFIIVMNQEWLLVDYTYALFKADKYFPTTKREYKDVLQEMDKLDSDKPLYLVYQEFIDITGNENFIIENEDMKNNNREQEFIDNIKNLKICKKFEEIGRTTLFQRKSKIVRLN